MSERWEWEIVNFTFLTISLYASLVVLFLLVLARSLLLQISSCRERVLRRCDAVARSGMQARCVRICCALKCLKKLALISLMARLC